MASISFASVASVLLMLLSLSATQPSYRLYVSSFQLYRQQHHSQHCPTISTRSSTSSPPYSYRRRPEAPRPSSTLVTTRQQTASLHAPSSSSSSSSTSHSPFKILNPLVHKDLNELEHFNGFKDDYDVDVDDEEFQLEKKKRSLLINTNSNINNNIYEPATSTSVQQQRQQQQSPLLEDREAEYQRRRDEWAHRYTRVQGLRDAFGNNKNGLWGDLDAKSTRRLYKTLLPNALCELIMDLDLAYVKPEDLAPLAYKARKAAKLYARERCHLPTRIMAQLFDGLRALRTYGKFQPQGLTYSQIWDKYQRLILEDVDDTITEEEIVARTCLKIMERSCKTNAGIDRLFLKNHHHGHHHLHDGSSSSSTSSKRNSDLQKITQTLESDVRKLLDPFSEGQQQVCRARGRGSGSSSSSSSAAATCQRPHITPQQYHALKHFALARRQQQLEAFAAAARYNNNNNARAKAAPSKQ
eukprot:CAMPEP_0113501732 /NCGR_PEP_ID=MMETSP0014_2-20120614/33125_1 /TAXON_ID=2857 /ORGANISM="Nitzschia sp." /LENGTH=468 /DNA_ID=CAMNT_0000396367 /DNA_START=827 /DNA_END=2233 /DNA_ORIENTATION=+ /assembly_acc=CAM_ASM_000159